VTRTAITDPERARGSAHQPSSLLVPDDRRDPEGHDFRRALYAVGVGYVLLAVVMLGIGLVLTRPLEHTVGQWDESVNRWLALHRTPVWNTITGGMTRLVDTIPAIVIAFVITAVLGLRHRWREAVMLVVALVLELGVFLSVTWVIARPRPDVVRLNSSPSTGSFPSGHTAAATVLCFGLAIIVMCCSPNMLIRVGTYVFAFAATVLVGFGRVYRGMHHPTDVFAGALLGAGCLVVAILAVRAIAVRGPATARTSAEPESQGIRTRVA
jgi:undecaprenyl-diphosphatase